MLRVGVHTSISGGLDKSVDRAYELGCTAFQIFTRNPRGWRYQSLKDEEVLLYREKIERYGFKGYNVAHMPYLPNLSSPDEGIYSKSMDSLLNEVERCKALGIPYLVIHLGSHMGKGFTSGKKRLVGAVEKALDNTNGEVKILLENMAGQRNSMGSQFEDLASLFNDLRGVSSDVGVCFDTAHAYSAGYDLSTRNGVRSTFEEFDSLIGWDNVYVIHLNDAKHAIGSGRDQHEHIGLGHIGERGFKYILENEFIRRKPLILETPIDERRGDIGNIATVWRLAGEEPPEDIVRRWMDYIDRNKNEVDRKIVEELIG